MNATTTRAQQATLAFVYDAGHGWLAVSLDEEHGLPEAVNFASQYSYLDITGDNFAGIVYLEEDADAVAFIKAYGIDFTVVPQHGLPEDNAIRDLPRVTK